jgi:branched-subunit amino acid ABC-type transport system permease component
MQYLQYLAFGLVTGSILLLGSFGFSMVWRTENFLNLAHGQYLMVGAYLSYVFYMVLHWPLFVAVILAVVLTGVVGWLTDVVFFRPIRRLGPMYRLVTSVGVAYVISGTMAAIFGPKPKGLVISRPPNIMIGGKPFTDALAVLIVCIAAASAVGLHLFLTRTRAGLSVRAMSSSFSLAQARGINTKRTAGVVWVMSAGLAGLAGVLMGTIGAIYYDMGWSVTIVILSAAVLGGLGSIYGVMIGAILIGLAMDTSVIVMPTAYRSAVPFIVIMLVLIFRPRGLSGSYNNG